MLYDIPVGIPQHGYFRILPLNHPFQYDFPFGDPPLTETPICGCLQGHKGPQLQIYQPAMFLVCSEPFLDDGLPYTAYLDDLR